MFTLFPIKLKETRESQNWSIKALADEMKVSDSLIRKWESTNPDVRRDPSTIQLMKLGDVLSVSVDYLLGRQESPSIDQYIKDNLEEILRKHPIPIGDRIYSMKEIEAIIKLAETLKKFL